MADTIRVREMLDDEFPSSQVMEKHVDEKTHPSHFIFFIHS